MPSRSWRPALLAVLVVAGLAATWSAFWYVTRHQIEAEIARQQAVVQSRGGDFECAERAWSGFPLRVTLRCQRTVFAVLDGPVITLAGLELSSVLYRPGHVVAVAGAPTRVEPQGDEAATVDHTPLRIELNVRPGSEPSGRAAIETMGVSTPAGWSFTGRRIAVEAAGLGPDRLAFSASGQDLTLDHGTARLVALDALSVRGRLEDLPDVPAVDPKALIAAAVRQGSQVTIESFDARLASVVLTASGSVRLAASGPTGTVTTTVSNLDAFLRDLEQRGLISRQAAQAAALVIGLLQRNRDDGAVTVDLRLHEGRVFWGPFAIAEIPPLQ